MSDDLIIPRDDLPLPLQLVAFTGGAILAAASLSCALRKWAGVPLW